MATGDTYELFDHYVTAGGVEMLNVYTYRGTGTGVAADLVQAFQDDVMAPILGQQPTDITHYLIKAQSLFDPSDFASDSVNLDGVWGVGGLTPFTAVQFTFRVPTRLIRPGGKRIGTVPEDASLDGVINNATYITAIEATRVQLGATINPSGVGAATFEPVLVKREKYTTSGGSEAYRMPTVKATALVVAIQSVAVQLNVASQVSRKY